MAAHEVAFMSLFTRQSGGQRVVPNQDSEDTQQQFSRLAHVQLKPFYRLSTRDVTHVRKCTRPSPALPYCKRRKAGWGPRNEASAHVCSCSTVPEFCHDVSDQQMPHMAPIILPQLLKVILESQVVAMVTSMFSPCHGCCPAPSSGVRCSYTQSGRPHLQYLHGSHLCHE